MQSSLSCASGSGDASVRLWDIQTGHCLHKLTGHASTVTSVVCSATHVASVAMDDRLCIWDRSKGHLIRCVQMVNVVLFMYHRIGFCIMCIYLHAVIFRCHLNILLYYTIVMFFVMLCYVMLYFVGIFILF